MRFFFYLFMILLICYPSGASAEFYKYTDKNGVVRFTDDLTQVPKDQRPEMKSYTGSEENLAPAAGPKPAGDSAEARSEAGAAAGGQEIRGRDFENINKERESLNKTRDALDKEYADLTREKEALTQARDQVKTDAEAKAHNEKIRNLNERIENYVRRRNAFDERAKAFTEAEKKVIDR